jgi:hypothetical protein
MNPLLFKADYPLDAQGIYSTESTLCECSEFYIVAPVSGAGTGGMLAQGNAAACRTTPCTHSCCCVAVLS